MYKAVKAKNPDKDYPLSMGNKWTKNEEVELLEELSNGESKESIARKHNRTTGGINCRIKLLAYKMFEDGIPIEEIMERTRLTESNILEYVENTRNEKSKKISNKSPILADDIKDIKDQIRDMNKKITKIFEILDALELS